MSLSDFLYVVTGHWVLEKERKREREIYIEVILSFCLVILIQGNIKERVTHDRERFFVHSIAKYALQMRDDCDKGERSSRMEPRDLIFIVICLSKNFIILSPIGSSGSHIEFEYYSIHYNFCHNLSTFDGGRLIFFFLIYFFLENTDNSSSSRIGD